MDCLEAGMKDSDTKDRGISVRSVSVPLALAILSFAVTALVGGCGSKGTSGPAGEDPESSSSAESALRSLVREYEIRNVAGFMDRVHAEYEAGTVNRDDLRYQVSRVQGQYGNIDLKLYGLDVRERGSTRLIRTDWELSWTCLSPGPGCTMNDGEVRRQGRTTFVFRRSSDRDEGRWRLISERDSSFFGRFQPGRVVQ